MLEKWKSIMHRISLTSLTFLLLISLNNVCSSESISKYAKCPEMFALKLEGECSFTVSEWTYYINSFGKGYRTNKKNHRQEFNLNLQKNDYIEGIQYVPFEKDIIIIYGVSDGDGAAGIVVRLGEKNLDIKWSAWVPAFNISKGLVESNFLYLSGRGFVSKINLQKGIFVWKHDNLCEGANGAFNSFEMAIISEDEIIFRDPEKQKEIRVNNETGKLKIY